ncbi:Arc family DNA-binding protein [Salmonella enterica]|uniref:Arc family DNA-binding protein n=2 Tax=Salmonella enterica TaxID=28901 RepID=A0A5U5WQT4_SALER|nr:Arc family DNA-binding protein [Salmonella enterica]EAW1320805.1 Arc family DNA-binding protein [Salmonella enterica subsp. diarizonae]EBV5774726.1 Arc family DNA-binding protein [Salmonella enterica subsp. enterica serovar Monophasic]ECF5976083.1 Arc family DNA-binding protein [Salmonella enterica subsp. arizonae]ECH8234482.1 Arc family DNA-binding protein [Salmonella enterica subsp. enterica]ECS6114544.1 Arc family DNA-binding protein [Salmonella enterica subsp. enterica serovar Sandiego]
MSREDAQMKIRLPAELKEQLEKAAQENKRSMNAEVLHRLKESFNVLVHITYKDSDKDLSDSNIWKRFLETSDQCDEDTKVFVKLFEEKYKLDKENERLYHLLINHLSHKKNESN